MAKNKTIRKQLNAIQEKMGENKTKQSTATALAFQFGNIPSQMHAICRPVIST